MTEAPAATPRPVLVLYAPADEPFVRGYLVPALGTLAPAATPAAGGGDPAIDVRDLAAAATAELDQALRQGGVAVAVITPAFLANPWARLSELLASDASVERELELIPLVLEDCALPLHIRDKVQLDFRARGDWETETQRLRDHLARPAPAEPPLACPYPGLRPFDAADAGWFHGRDAEVDAVLALVAAGERELTLVGPSGSGKSSLIAAGVLPRLAAQPGAPALTVRTMRPGDAPRRRLAECLETAAIAAPDAADAMNPANPVNATNAVIAAATAAAVAAWTAGHAGARLVVFVDQLEELFTQAPPAERDGFAAALGALRDEPRCLVVLALRADFYAELLQSPLWLDGRRRHVDLPPLRGPALRAAIERPARDQGVYLEPGLVERLLADAAGEPGVLPLLQDTLVQLWGRRRRRLLALADYEALGDGGRSGLAVAISSRADRCLGEMTPAQAQVARRLLLRLVSFGDGRPNTRRRQRRTQLTTGEAPGDAEAVLRQLVAARLITMDGDGDGPAEADQVDLCHEALITAWPSFAAWVASRRADELRRRQIQASAENWLARGRGASGLYDDVELAAALAWRRSDAARELGESPEVTALIDASRHALIQARSRRRRWIAAGCAVLVAFTAVAVTLAVAARRQANIAERERRAADHRLAEQYRDTGRQAVVDGHFQRAIPYLVAARDRGLDDPGLRLLFRTAAASAVAVAIPHGGPVTAVSFGPDGTRIATGCLDGTARVWDAASGAPLTPPLPHATAVDAVTFAPDGAHLLAISGATAWIWDLTAPPPSRIALPHADQIHTAVFSADGARVVTASEDHTARLWDAHTGAVLQTLAHDTVVNSAELSRDGSRIVTTVNTGTAAGIWDAATGARIAPLGTDFFSAPDVVHPRIHLDLVTSATFSPDGTRLATTGADRLAMLWSPATGETIAPALVHDAPVRSAAFSPDGTRLATVTLDGRVQLWDAASGAAAGGLIDPPSPVVHVTYSRDGTRLLAETSDKVVQIWDVADAHRAATLELEAGARDAAISPDGTRAVTASADGFARVWTLPAAPRVLPSGERLFDAAYSPDGAWIATSDATGEVRFWAASGAPRATLSPRVNAARVVFDPSGRRFAAVGLDGNTRLGEVDTLALRELQRDPRDRRSWGDGPDEIVGHMPALAAFSPDGRWFATATGPRSAELWDAATGRAAAPPLDHGAAIATIRFSPDGRCVVTAGKDGAARIWDAASGAPIDPPLAHPAGRAVSSALYSPDGRRIATVAGDGRVRLWNAASHRLQAELTGHAGWIIAAVFSPDGARLVTYSDDHTARIWDVAGGVLAAPPLEHAGRVESAAFSPDGTRLVTTCQNLAQQWDVATGNPLGPPLAHPQALRTAMFSPDGAWLVTAALDAVRIWSAALDTGTLDDWHRIARNNSFPQLGEALARLAPPEVTP